MRKSDFYVEVFAAGISSIIEDFGDQIDGINAKALNFL